MSNDNNGVKMVLETSKGALTGGVKIDGEVIGLALRNDGIKLDHTSPKILIGGEWYDAKSSNDVGRGNANYRVFGRGITAFVYLNRRDKKHLNYAMIYEWDDQQVPVANPF